MGVPNLPLADVQTVRPDAGIDTLARDGTIGHLMADAPVRGQLKVDATRLIMATLAYRDAFDDKPTLAIVEPEDGDVDAALALTRDDDGFEAILLAPVVLDGGDTTLRGLEELVDDDEGSD